MCIGLWTRSAEASIESSPLFPGPVVLNLGIV